MSDETSPRSISRASANKSSSYWKNIGSILLLLLLMPVLLPLIPLYLVYKIAKLLP